MLFLESGYNDGVSVAAENVISFLPYDDTDDSVFLLFKEIIGVKIDSRLYDAKVYYSFIGNKKITYNLDYIKGIIYRILFDSLLNHPDIYDVNFVLNLRSHYRNKENRERFKTRNELQFLRNPQGSVKPLFEESVVEFYLEDAKENDNFNWLVIKNTLGSDVKYKLEDIYRKLDDPIDYNDGHISIVALHEYTCKLHHMNKSYAHGNLILS